MLILLFNSDEFHITPVGEIGRLEPSLELLKVNYPDSRIFVEPEAVTTEDLLRAHSQAHNELIQNNYSRSLNFITHLDSLFFQLFFNFFQNWFRSSTEYFPFFGRLKHIFKNPMLTIIPALAETVKIFGNF